LKVLEFNFPDLKALKVLENIVGAGKSLNFFEVVLENFLFLEFRSSNQTVQTISRMKLAKK
jgi:hypothetical protein